MGFLKDVWDFERLNVEEYAKEIKRHPWRMATGVDQGSTSVWNRILGRDDKPLTNWAGGPSGDMYAKASSKGVSTSSAHKLHDVGEVVAGLYLGAQYLPDAGASGTSGTSSAPAKAGVSRLEGAGMGLQMAGNAMDGANYESPMSPNEYWAEPLQYQDQYSEQYGYSSKRLKKKKGDAGGSKVMDALGSGDPIDQNGAEIVLIQALSERVALLKRKLASLKSGRRS